MANVRVPKVEIRFNVQRLPEAKNEIHRPEVKMVGVSQQRAKFNVARYLFGSQMVGQNEANYPRVGKNIPAPDLTRNYSWVCSADPNSALGDLLGCPGYGNTPRTPFIISFFTDGGSTPVTLVVVALNTRREGEGYVTYECVIRGDARGHAAFSLLVGAVSPRSFTFNLESSFTEASSIARALLWRQFNIMAARTAVQRDVSIGTTEIRFFENVPNREVHSSPLPLDGTTHSAAVREIALGKAEASEMRLALRECVQSKYELAAGGDALTSPAVLADPLLWAALALGRNPDNVVNREGLALLERAPVPEKIVSYRPDPATDTTFSDYLRGAAASLRREGAFARRSVRRGTGDAEVLDQIANSFGLRELPLSPQAPGDLTVFVVKERAVDAGKPMEMWLEDAVSSVLQGRPVIVELGEPWTTAVQDSDLKFETRARAQYALVRGIVDFAAVNNRQDLIDGLERSRVLPDLGAVTPVPDASGAKEIAGRAAARFGIQEQFYYVAAKDIPDAVALRIALQKYAPNAGWLAFSVGKALCVAGEASAELIPALSELEKTVASIRKDVLAALGSSKKKESNELFLALEPQDVPRREAAVPHPYALSGILSYSIKVGAEKIVLSGIVDISSAAPTGPAEPTIPATLATPIRRTTPPAPKTHGPPGSPKARKRVAHG